MLHKSPDNPDNAQKNDNDCFELILILFLFLYLVGFSFNCLLLPNLSPVDCQSGFIYLQMYYRKCCESF